MAAALPLCQHLLDQLSESVQSAGLSTEPISLKQRLATFSVKSRMLLILVFAGCAATVFVA